MHYLSWELTIAHTARSHTIQIDRKKTSLQFSHKQLVPITLLVTMLLRVVYWTGPGVEVPHSRLNHLSNATFTCQLSKAWTSLLVHSSVFCLSFQRLMLVKKVLQVFKNEYFVNQIYAFKQRKSMVFLFFLKCVPFNWKFEANSARGMIGRAVFTIGIAPLCWVRLQKILIAMLDFYVLF